MKILITGARGLLGSNLALMYSGNNEVIATGINKPSFDFCRNYNLNIMKKEDMDIIEKEMPDLLINCVALTNVDYCEDHYDESKIINAEGARNLAEICKKNNIYFIHISTDGIFDGKKGNYSEEDMPNPINVYGKTKLLAEKFVKETGGKYAIIRTNIYGWNHEEKFSLAEMILDKLRKKEKLKGFRDTFFSPILTTNLGRAILELYEKNYQGIINIAGSETDSKLDFAKKIAQIFGENESLIESISIDDFKLRAKRPKNLSLNVNKARKILKTRLLNVEEGLKEFKDLEDEGFIKRLKYHNL